MNPTFDIEIIERDHTLILKVSGELDLSSAPLLDKQLELAETSDAASVVVDLDQVEFMDSSGLQVLIARVALSGNGNGNATRYSVTRGSRQVQRLFEVAGVMDRLPFASD
jgi:anti-sigma B factor antagonist